MFAISAVSSGFTRQCCNFLKITPCNASPSSQLSSVSAKPSLLGVQKTELMPVRHRVIYSLSGGKPETVQDVVDRFFRLYNGMWIRTKAGRNKKKWKKTSRRIARSKQHVFCTKRQCWTLDKMVNLEYKVPHYYMDDPYEVYHRKSNVSGYRYEPQKFYP